MDTANLKKLVVATIHMINRGGTALEDGKISVTDLPELFNIVVVDLPSLSGVSFATIKEEIADLSQDEIQALCVLVKQEFEIPQDKIEAMVEIALDVLVAIFGAISAFKALK